MKEIVFFNGVYVILLFILCFSFIFSFNVFWVINICVVVIVLCDWVLSFEYNYLILVFCFNFEC